TATADCAPIDTLASSAEPAIAPTAIVSIVIREPNRPIRIAPRIAPTTPPKLNAVSPLLATLAPKPAVVRSDGTQFTPAYTESRQKKNEAHSASVSRRNSGTSSALTDGCATLVSRASANAASAGTS